MGMSSHVVGFRPADEEWDRMKAVWEACEKAEVPIPCEVNDYFDGESPGNKPGMEVSLGEVVRRYSTDARDGFDVDLIKLPRGIRYIRFFNAW